MESKSRIRVSGNFWFPVEPDVVAYFWNGDVRDTPPLHQNLSFTTFVRDQKTFEARGGWNWFRVHLIGEPEDNRKTPGA